MRALAISMLLVMPWLPGCGAEPVCSAEVGRPGSSIPLCSAIDERAVCDDLGVMASYVRDAGGRLVLMNGTLASCDASDQVVCPDPETVARCIVQPAVE